MAPSLHTFLVIANLLVFIGSYGVVSQGAIRSLHISTDIVYRFATTSVRSVIVNTREYPDDVTFIYHLPRESFISNFTMTIDTVKYSGRLEGIETKRLYRTAERNEAGNETTRVRDTNLFKFNIRLSPGREVTFDLVYHEFLSRKLSTHSHVVYLDPGQIIPDLNVSVNIVESRALTLLSVPPIQDFSSDTTSNGIAQQSADLTWRAPNAATIKFNPTIQEQRESSPGGISGKFSVNYDVSRTSDAGQLQVINGYFIHYFAPAGYRSLPRRIVFVLDVSGSMQGEKIAQLKSAMTSILNELQDQDMFNIIVFSSRATRWQRSLVSASAANKDAALQWFRRFPVDGTTNINDALVDALSDLHRVGRSPGEAKGSPYVLFLTDGDPTSGETDSAKILSNLKVYNTQGFPIYSIGFGDDVKIPFLRRISIQSGGFARKIYATSDASLQLQGFFNEISSPLFNNVQITYAGNTVDETTLTRTHYDVFFNGSEIFITGRLRVPSITGITASVSAETWIGPLVLSKQSTGASYGLEVPSVTVLNQNIEKMWAYSIIRDTVRRAFETNNRLERTTLRRRTRDLSLRYNILSPATILVAPSPYSSGQVIDIIQADSPSQDNDDQPDPGTDDRKPEAGNTPSPVHTLPEVENEAEPMTGAPRPKYPDQPEYPEKPEYPNQPERPEYPNQPERPEYPYQPERPEYPNQPERPEYPNQAERPEYPNQPERPEYPNQPERPEYPNQPERLEYPNQPERPEYTNEPQTSEYDYPEEPNPTTSYRELPSTKTPGQPETHPGRQERPTDPEYPARPGTEKPGQPTKPPSASGVDSDPHIILDAKNLRDEFVCFDLFGNPGDIYRLLIDPVSRVTVNAKIVPRKYKRGMSAKHQATYFGMIGLTHGNTKIIITPEGIKFGEVHFKWEEVTNLSQGDVSLIGAASGQKLQIKIGRHIQFMVLQHMEEHNHKLDTPYLGFYLIDTNGLSPYSGGILGEFINLQVHVDISHKEAEERDMPGHLTRIDQSQRSQIMVYPGRRLNMATNEKVKCWHVRNSGRGLLKRKLHEYITPRLI